MFPVEKLSQFESTNPSYRILKPWWDVFTDYLSAVIVIIALSAGAMQVLRGDLICLPTAECNLTKVAHDSRNGCIPVSTSFLRTNQSFCQKYYASATRDSKMTVIALTKLGDRRQYDFVDAQCGREAVHWFASYLPFILFLQAVILVIVDNFWLKFPKTSSTMDHFVKLVLECFYSPGTCLDVCNVLWGTRISEDSESNATEDIEQGTGERDALLRNNTEEDALSVQIPSTQSALELSEAIKAKTLCEKIRHFQRDLENCQLLGRIYLAQAFMQMLFSLSFFIMNVVHHCNVTSTVKCDIDDIDDIHGAIYGHDNYFKCSYAIAVYFHLTLIIFYILIITYCFLCPGMFIWTCLKLKKQSFTFEQVQSFQTEALELGDIKEVKGDLAFMLHLLNEYNKLYLNRFAVFLSQKNEKNLKDFILSRKWPLHKLERMSTENGTNLRLNSLTGIPKAIFQLSELESLTLEECSLTEEDFDPKDWQKLELQSLSLVRCRLKSIPKAICQNCKSLETLDLSHNMITSVPKNIADLHYLHTLNIAGNKVTEGVEHIIKIDRLQVLDLKENDSLQNVPDQIASHPMLRKLYVDETLVSNMSEEMKTTLQGVIHTGRRSPDDVTVLKYLPSKAPNIEKARKDRERVYKMTSNPKGLAMIFNFVSYEHPHGVTRYGSNVDAERLEKLFLDIGYYVEVRKDPPSAKAFLTEVSNILAIHATGDSVVVAVMANGSKEGVFCCNWEIVSVDDIVSIVGEAGIYKNKPKLIFIDACRDDNSMVHYPTEFSSPVKHPLRGDKEGTSTMHLETISMNLVGSDSAQRERESDSAERFRKPAYDDVLIGYSTPPGFVSYQNIKKDSRYIGCLVDVFSQYACEEDLLSLLTFVNYSVSRKFTAERGFWQIPAPQSSLTKKLFFLPGYFEDDDLSSTASTST